VSTQLFLLQATAAADSAQWPGYLAGWEVPLTTLARAALVLVITWYLASRARHWFERATAATRADANTRLAVGRLLSVIVLVVGAATLLDTFGIPLSAVVTIVGVVGLAISLAMQDILKNFFAGLYLLFERPFRLGDQVAIKDQRGVVETIGIRTTTLRTDENVYVMIPNAVMFAEIVSNRTYFKPKPADEAPTNGEVPDASAAPAAAGAKAAEPAAR
jgi:small-conductance mechanosensitive channel